MEGQVWRLLTFIFVPTSGYNPNDMFTILWFAMTTLFYYYIGNSLERQWALPALPSSTVWAWC